MGSSMLLLAGAALLMMTQQATASMAMIKSESANTRMSEIMPLRFSSSAIYLPSSSSESKLSLTA